MGVESSLDDTSIDIDPHCGGHDDGKSERAAGTLREVWPIEDPAEEEAADDAESGRDEG